MSLNSRQQVTGDTHTLSQKQAAAPNPATGHDTSFRIPANLGAHSPIEEVHKVGSLHSRAVQDL